MAKGDDIEERLVDFAVQIIRLCEQLPGSTAGRHIAGQLLRSGTAPAAHYAEARSAESSKDFIHKLKIGLKELNESRVWLKIARKSGLLKPELVHSPMKECDELSRIIGASIKTARKRLVNN